MPAIREILTSRWKFDGVPRLKPVRAALDAALDAADAVTAKHEIKNDGYRLMVRHAPQQFERPDIAPASRAERFHCGFPGCPSYSPKSTALLRPVW